MNCVIHKSLCGQTESNMNYRFGSRMNRCGVFFCLFLCVSNARAGQALLDLGFVGLNLTTSTIPFAGLIGMASVGIIPSAGLMGMGAVGINREQRTLRGLGLKLDKDVDTVGIKTDLGRFIPDIKIKVGYTDNLTLTSVDQISAFYTEVSTHGTYVVSDKTRKFVLDYLLDTGFYEGSSADNFIDHRIRAGFDYQPTSRIFTALNTEFMLAHDARGEGRARGGAGITQDSIDEWHQWGIGGQFVYGVPTARGRIELESGYITKTYTTNRQFTVFRDQDNVYGDAAFTYRIRPKTALTLEGKITNFSYARDFPGSPTLDSMNYRLLTGVTWEATFKTTGFAKVGYIIKDFESNQRDDSAELSWQVGIDWRPRSYSVVHLETEQRTDETDGTGDSVNTSYSSINWEHFWRTHFSTRLEFIYQNNTYEPTIREDDYFGAAISANYTFRRWLSLGAEYRYLNVDSNDEVFSFEENAFELTLDIVF